VRATPELWHHLGVPVLFAALALGFRQDLVFLLGALVMGCALAAAPLCRRNLRGIVVTRTLPVRARVGVATGVEVEVVNEGPEDAVGLEVEQPHPRTVQPVEGRLEVPCLAAGRAVRGRLPLTFQARGRQTLPASSVTSRYPLGAFRARLPGSEAASLVVWPREGRPTAALLARLAGGGEDLRPRRPVGRGSDDLFGVRPWREGDDPRRIHALSTARRGEAMVTDWRALPGHETWVVLGRLKGAPHEGLFERGVSVAATIWSALARAKRPGQLLVGGTTQRGGPQGLAAGLDLLALARPRAIAPARQRLRELARRPAPRQVIVVGGPDDRSLLEEALRAAGTSGSAWWLDARSPQVERWVKGLDA
jgi:uncharacterized protein (DUF58 family)